MLLLRCKTDESIVVNGNIEVKVAEIHANRVRIAVCAPDSVPIDREEVAQRRAAAGGLEERLGYAVG